MRETKALENNMRVVNICLNGPYTSGFTYQDNLLPKWQRRNGNEVIVIAPTTEFTVDGNIAAVPECDYCDSDGVRIIRIDNDQNKPCNYRFKTYSTLSGILDNLAPDVIFLHGCQLLDARTIRCYMKTHESARLLVDNHADFSNSATNWVSRTLLHGILWKHCAHLLLPYTERFWGVLPSRVDFLTDVYKIPHKKCGLLVMGADDDEVSRVKDPAIRLGIRNKFCIGSNDFLVVTGGKIDKAKRQVIDLMKEFSSDENPNLKLLTFGPIDKDMRAEANEYTDGVKVQHIPWANTSESYELLSAADLVVFPGRHSVYWEEAVGIGKPIIVKYWKGTTHIDCGGNCVLIDSDDASRFYKTIKRLSRSTEKYTRMKASAEKAASKFQYGEIARLSISQGDSI